MKPPPQHEHDAESPPEQKMPGGLSSIRRRLPRSALFVGSCIVAAFVMTVIVASLVSNQAAELFNVWIDRMTF